MSNVRILAYDRKGAPLIMKVVILDRRLYDFEAERYALGGVTTYLRNLVPVINGLGLETHFLFDDGHEDSREVDGAYLHSVVTKKGRLVETLIGRAASMFDSESDLLLFSTSTLVRKTPFKHTIAIQHGIYWDVQTIHGRVVTRRGSSLALRALQAKRQLDTHSLVSQMVCVDLNYVNWMRALSVANRLPYRYIPNFADTSAPVSERPADGRVRIVFARRFEAIRGCGLLMEVMPRILARHPEVELVVAGGGSMEAELRERLSTDPRVEFTRFDADDSIAFHGGFDIALVPSVASEGTSLSLLEAMAAGCAVVATDVGGLSNIVLDGHNCVLIRPEAPELESGIELLLSNPQLRQRLASNARRTVEESFSRDRWAKSWSEVLVKYM